MDAKAAANWLNNEILGRLNRDGLSITEVPVSAAANNAIIDDDRGRAPSPARSPRTCSTSSGAKAAIPVQMVEARGLRQVTDTGAIDAAIEAVIAANPDKVEEVKAKPKLAAWFVGQVMKQTGGKANPAPSTPLSRRDSICPKRGDSHKMRKLLTRSAAILQEI